MIHHESYTHSVGVEFPVVKIKSAYYAITIVVDTN